MTAVSAAKEDFTSVYDSLYFLSNLKKFRTTRLSTFLFFYFPALATRLAGVSALVYTPGDSALATRALSVCSAQRHFTECLTLNRSKFVASAAARGLAHITLPVHSFNPEFLRFTRSDASRAPAP